ncbi:hypothetical protein ACS386_08040 [Flavobacteriaceae bacterium LMO-SS05]
MAKKNSRLPIVFIIFLTVASCCDDPMDIFFKAKDIEIHNTHKFRNIGDGITVNQQDYRIRCFLNAKTVKDISDINDFRYSRGGCEDNFVGLKKDIANLTISCNKNIWNTPSGNPLDNTNIRFYENKFGEDSENVRLTVDEWLAFVNNEDQLVTFEWYIEFIETIDSTEYLKFQLLFEIVDGSEYITETESVKFE